MSALQTDRPRFHAPRLLAATLLFVGMIVVGLVVIPGFASFAPSNAIANPSIVIDHLALAVGEYKEYQTEGGVTIAVYRRTPEEVRSMANSSAVRYPASLVEQDLPTGAGQLGRSVHPEYFVFYPKETRWGCKTIHVRNGNEAGLPGWDGGFFDPCHFDYAYDHVGWSLERANRKSEYMWLPSRNLIVPRHEYREGKLVVHPAPGDLRNKIGSLE